MSVTYGFSAAGYGFPNNDGRRRWRSRGTTMANDIEFMSLATGVLFAGTALSVYIGHCMSFAVACF
jgi:hypothetical protein